MKQAGGMAGGPEQAGPWYQWGPYLSERAWGTVREDYSADGNAWKYFPFDHAHARAFRWNEDGMAGLSDLLQDTCFAVALVERQGPDPQGTPVRCSTAQQGNHGEDVKEYYWYRDARPRTRGCAGATTTRRTTFPYDDLLATNAERDRTEPEYELIDTGVFDDDRYWVVDVDYAKATPTDISIRITVTNAGPDEATLDVLPTLWFRNTWGWGRGHPVPEMRVDTGALMATHWRSGTYHLDPGPLPDGTSPDPGALQQRDQRRAAVRRSRTSPPTRRTASTGTCASANPASTRRTAGTKGAWWYRLTVPAGQSREIRLRLWKSPDNKRNPRGPGRAFDELFATREAEADEFYGDLAPENCPSAELVAMRVAFAGMIWSKQFYRYDVPALARRRPRAASPAATETAAQPQLAARRRLRRHLDAGRLGVPVVRRLGPGVPHRGVHPRRPVVREVPTAAHVPGVVHASQRRPARLRVELR